MNCFDSLQYDGKMRNNLIAGLNYIAIFPLRSMKCLINLYFEGTPEENSSMYFYVNPYIHDNLQD